MSGIEYYTITGFLKSSGRVDAAGTSTESELTFPTSPMYLDKERYNGRNMIWLKSFNCGAEMVRDNKRLQIKRTLEGISPSLFLTIPSLNSFGVDVPARDGETKLIDQAIGGTIFKSLATAKMCNFPFAFNTQTFPLQNDEIETGDIFTDADLVKHIIVRPYNCKYENPDVGNPATALITNNIWGSRCNAVLGHSKCNKTTAGIYVDAGSVIEVGGIELAFEYELVIKPLLNEPVPRPFLLEDEKNRNRY